MWEVITEVFKMLAIVIVLMFIAFSVYARGWEAGQENYLEEMNKYGNVRIDGKVYVIEEVISGDK